MAPQLLGRQEALELPQLLGLPERQQAQMQV